VSQELCPEVASSLGKLLAMDEEQVEMLGFSFAVRQAYFVCYNWCAATLVLHGASAARKASMDASSADF
jgi:hypothetical protein